MNEKELIGKLRELRQIKPNKDWAVLTKEQILGPETAVSGTDILRVLFARPKLALAALLLVAIIAGAAVFVNYSPEPTIVQKDKDIEEAEEAKEELALLHEQVAELQGAIEAVIAETAKKIAEVDLETTDQESFKKVVLQARQVIKEVEKIEQSFAVLGVKFDTKEDLAAATDELTEKNLAKVNLEEIIEVWEPMAASGDLSQEKKELLGEMKKLFEEEEYFEAWELYLTNQ